MSEASWYHHGAFKTHLSRNENNSYYVVEEYGIKKFKILSFKDVAAFVKQLPLPEKHSKNITKSYYNIFFNHRRYLYLDFDIYLQHRINHQNVYSIGKEIIRILVNFYNIHKTNEQFRLKELTLTDFYIFDSSRCGKFQQKAKQFAFKISLHIYCCKVVFDNLSLLRNHLSILKQFVHIYRNLFTIPSDILDLAAHSFECIDESVYKDIQYFRCFQCCKYNEPVSIKQLLYPNGGLSYTDIIKIMQVDVVKRDDICIHYKRTSPPLVNMVRKQRIVSFVPNAKSSTSIQSKYLMKYIFAANNNQLQWEEHRIYMDSSMKSIEYFCMNSNIKYPRLFVKLSGLSIKEMEQLDIALQRFDIHIKDTYVSLFTHFKRDIPEEIEYTIYFNEKNVTIHGDHTPSSIKKHSKLGIAKYGKRLYALYCRNCAQYFDLY